MDFDFLLGARLPEVPNPVRDAIEGYSLRDLARRDREGALREQGLTDQRRAAEAYNKAIPAVIQSGFDERVVAQVLQQYPEAAPLIQKAWDDYAKRRDEGKKTDATVYKDKTASLLKQYSQMSAGLADAIKRDPASVPEGMIAKFYAGMAENGLETFMPALPFQSWSDKGAVVAHLTQLGNAFYETSDRIRNTETGRHNTATEGLTAARDAESGRHNVATEKTAAGNLAVAQGNLGLARDKAKREASDTSKPKHIVDLEMKLSDDYAKQSKAFQETARQMGIVNSALDMATTNPGAALAAGTSFMKILDPNSVVRESELGMALNASGWFDRAANVGQMLKSGRVMTKAQVDSLRREAGALFREAAAAQKKVDAQFSARARRYGADPQNIILDLGQSGAEGTRPPLGMGEGFGSGVGTPKGSGKLMEAPKGSGAQFVYVPRGN